MALAVSGEITALPFLAPRLMNSTGLFDWATDIRLRVSSETARPVNARDSLALCSGLSFAPILLADNFARVSAETARPLCLALIFALLSAECLWPHQPSPPSV